MCKLHLVSRQGYEPKKVVLSIEVILMELRLKWFELKLVGLKRKLEKYEKYQVLIPMQICRIKRIAFQYEK